MVEGKDEKTSEKFRKLMGIKSSDNLKSNTSQMNQMQQKVFEVMDKEYEWRKDTESLMSAREK